MRTDRGQRGGWARSGHAGIRTWVCGLALASACATGSSATVQERAQRQYELAVGLQAEGNYAGAFKTLQAALHLDSDNCRAHQLLGTLYLLHRMDDPAHHDRLAEEHFRRVLSHEAAAGEPEQALIADAYNGLGVLKMHQGKPEVAATLFERAIAADRFNAEVYMAWGNLGWARQQLGQSPAARTAFRRAIKLNPGFCVGHFRLGQTLLADKAYEAAERALTKALEVNAKCDRFQDAWHLRGTTRMNLGLREGARDDFERCVELAPRTHAGAACSRYLEAI